ncbi:MAG: hypothetical protein JRH20_02690 [Deltaproteobacteria bacterium]|nr:hypothetical protein [Deltaproteobacteria bacterium]
MHDLRTIRRCITDTPMVSAETLAKGATLEPGPIALQGRAAATGELINSPISGVPLIGYRIQFSELGFFGRVKASFAVRRVSPFALIIGDGHVEVSPTAHCYLYLTHEYRGTPEAMGSIASAAYKLYAQHAPGKKSRVPRLSWHEYYLEPGETTYVCGWLKEEFDMDRGEGYRAHRTRPVVCATEEHPLIIADYSRETLLQKIDTLPGH